MSMYSNDSALGNFIYTYTRARAIADGFQIEVTKTSQEAGIRLQVFLCRPSTPLRSTVSNRRRQAFPRFLRATAFAPAPS
jgi:hypothetical protein